MISSAFEAAKKFIAQKGLKQQQKKNNGMKRQQAHNNKLANGPMNTEEKGPTSTPAESSQIRRFLFYIFPNRFLQKYIFDFTIYKFIPLPPGRGWQGAYRPSAGRPATCRPPAGR